MAELSGHWTTTAGGTGHQQTSYTQAQLSTAYKVIAGCGNYEGVCPGLGDKLICAANGANTVSVGTGGAMVDGKWYYNDASLDVNIPSASGAGNTRIDRIVLRANWAGYEVAVTRIAGTDAASPSVPSLTQTSGTTYDIHLARVTVNTAGAVTVIYEPTMAYPYHASGLSVLGRDSNSAGITAPIAGVDGQVLRISGTSLDFGTITGAGIANDAIDSQHYAAGSIDGEHVANDAIDSQHYAAGSIDTEHVANDAIDYTKVGAGVSQFIKRQGGNASDWSFTGTTTYPSSGMLAGARMQAGAREVTFIGGQFTGGLAITFPQAFSNKPLVIVGGAVGSAGFVSGSATEITASGFTLNGWCSASATESVCLHWLAIGPE
jgi:hypothetical protein